MKTQLLVDSPRFIVTIGARNRRERNLRRVSVLVLLIALSNNFALAQEKSAGAKGASPGAATSPNEHVSTAAPGGELNPMDLVAQARGAMRLLFGRASEGQSSNSRSALMVIAPMGGPSLPVIGTGTAGRLAKWAGSAGSNSVIGDTAIFEDKLGKVGIGTDSPTSRLTVIGGIESTAGGFKFPDGSVQTTSATGSLLTVSHDATLVGGGTPASPLGLTVPLRLLGSANSPSPGVPAQILEVVNTGSGAGVTGRGAPGLLGLGTPAPALGGIGAIGMTGVGGDSTGPNSRGGAGVTAVGGGSDGVGGDGIFAAAGSGNAPGALAGRFLGSVSVSGTLSKGGGMFHIDHPLDPENKYLNHSFVESPDMKNIYDGTTTTDANGDAVVELPDWFEALNRDFRYQLTVIGTFAQAIVAEEVTDNRFAIKTNAPNVRVSWQVTGIRHDAFANKNRIQVEEEKPEVERGYYLHPEAFGQPEEKSINRAHDPEGMMRIKQRRNEAEQTREQKRNDR
ncbi:MAG TPA: hypothetical protein VFV34_16460 [Blastocatellia bacterium]|nr:hypothetical protein [Blastocatellia bacterium]